MALKALDLIRAEVGGQVEITSDFVGVQPSSYPINTIYLWTSGPHEAVLQLALKPTALRPRRGVQRTGPRTDRPRVAGSGPYRSKQETSSAR